MSTRIAELLSDGDARTDNEQAHEKFMTQSEAEVLAEVVAIFDDQTRFVRAIFSGRRRNMQRMRAF